MATFPLAHRNAQLDAENARTLQRLESETTTHHTTAKGATAGGDTRKLRGIPAIGRGVTGAIEGTQPALALDRDCNRRQHPG